MPPFTNLSIPADSKAPPAFDSSVLKQLACPACLGELRLEETSLLCTSCTRAYPIVDGIPVLIGGTRMESEDLSQLQNSSSGQI
jgi:uncharacterized protein YbaR (Trm112 family)